MFTHQFSQDNHSSCSNFRDNIIINYFLTLSASQTNNDDNNINQYVGRWFFLLCSPVSSGNFDFKLFFPLCLCGSIKYEYKIDIILFVHLLAHVWWQCFKIIYLWLLFFTQMILLVFGCLLFWVVKFLLNHQRLFS